MLECSLLAEQRAQGSCIDPAVHVGEEENSGIHCWWPLGEKRRDWGGTTTKSQTHPVTQYSIHSSAAKPSWRCCCLVGIPHMFKAANTTCMCRLDLWTVRWEVTVTQIYNCHRGAAIWPEKKGELVPFSGALLQCWVHCLNHGATQSMRHLIIRPALEWLVSLHQPLFHLNS